jgi:Flp pilus assembly protein TadD
MPKSTPETRKMAEKLRDDLFSGIEKEKQDHNDRGVEYAQKGELNKAREEFETAVKMDPGYPEALNNLGSVFYQEKKWEDAIRYYKRALERSPKYGEARYNLARALAHAGKLDEALTDAEEAGRLGQDAARLIETLQRAKQAKP